MASEVKKGSVFQPEVDTERQFIPIPGAIESDVVVFQSDFGRRKAMGSDERRLLKISIGTDMVQMFVGIDHQVDVPHLQAQTEELFLKKMKILIQT
jgi:hypothetical protein